MPEPVSPVSRQPTLPKLRSPRQPTCRPDFELSEDLLPCLEEEDRLDVHYRMNRQRHLHQVENMYPLDEELEEPIIAQPRATLPPMGADVMARTLPAEDRETLASGDSEILPELSVLVPELEAFIDALNEKFMLGAGVFPTAERKDRALVPFTPRLATVLRLLFA